MVLLGISLMASTAMPLPMEAVVPKGVVVPNAMAPLFDKYVACLDSKTDVAGVTDRDAFKSAVERGIASCRALRLQLAKEAETALTRDPQYRDQPSRARAVASAFDTQDEIQHAMGEGRVVYESK
jgi:hypothetical protein